MPELIPPTARLHAAWLEARAERGPGQHEDGFGLHSSDEVESPAGFAAWLARLAQSGPVCGTPFTGLGSDHVTEVLDWQVIVRLAAHCRRRYRRACRCPVPATVTAPGPPRAIGKGLFASGFTAMLLTERFVAGRSMNSLVTGLARHGAEISPAALAGTCAQAGALLVPLADAVAELVAPARGRDDVAGLRPA